MDGSEDDGHIADISIERTHRDRDKYTCHDIRHQAEYNRGCDIESV
jgi:hypothetical protein